LRRRFDGARIVIQSSNAGAARTPRFFGCRFAVEEEDVGLDSLGVEDAGGQAEQSVNVGLFEKFASHCLAGAAFEEDVVGNDNRSAAVFALGS